jgi:hypothetical protein
MRVVVIIFISVFAFGFDYFKVYSIYDFENFKLYKVKKSYIDRVLKMPKGQMNKKQQDKLAYIYEKEKMIRDTLLILSRKYNYKFMPYIAMLTQQHLFILEKFFDKYEIPVPKDMKLVGKFENENIQKEYLELLKKSLKEKKVAAQLSVGFMQDLINLYLENIYSKELPKDITRMLGTLNAFNKKVLYRFKKGLRNIEIGLPVE